ncbi:MAG: putative bifunctional diguanylate cyclase/phosphodiesterase [Neptuniibacter sp.]
MQTKIIQKQLFLPAVITLLLLFGVFALILQVAENRSIQEHSQHTLEVYKKEFENSFNGQANSILALLNVMTNVEGAREALEKQERLKLNGLFQEFYQKLRRTQGITHFYFHSPDLRNLIRLHDVGRYGDTIQRETSLRAQRTQRPSFGFELGVLGTFTLRAVAPVYLDNQLVGYIELGKEIEDIAADISNTFDLDWAVMIDKSYLVETDWKAGMQVLGRSAKWNQYPDVVISASSYTHAPELHDAFISGLNDESKLLSLNDTMRVGVIPLQDMKRKKVGWLLIFIDETEALRTSSVRDQFYLLFLGMIISLLLLIIWKVLGRADDQVIRNQEKLHHMAHHDELTGLPNRKFFYERLSHAIDLSTRHNRQLAVLFIDLDNFKDVNDMLGHDTGDEVLQCVAEHLRPHLRKDDTLARNSGDEFVILMEDIKDEHDCGVVADKIGDEFNRALKLSQQSVDLTASIGVAIFPQDGDCADDLMANADSAMYLAKEMGKNRYYFYNKKLAEATQRRIKLENGIRNALQEGRFSLVYQPQINLITEKISGVEALLRWQDPEMGFVSPVEFIPVAENIGAIQEIGKFVLFEACKQAREWLDHHYEFGKIAVNLSVRQLQSQDFVPSVREALNQFNLPAEMLTIEVTESLLMTHMDDGIEQLRALRKLGVTISIDDFGTGYSSLSQLKALPIQTLKIDRSFISDLPGDESDVVITKTIISMACNLGLDTIAEGVETIEQANFLKENDCVTIQGYLYSKPLTSSGIRSLFLSHSKDYAHSSVLFS